MKIVVQAISNLLLSALMVTTLLWGGCVSCPQFFMFPTTKIDCCNAGHCEQSKSQKHAPKKECNRMPLVPPGAAHVDFEPPPEIGVALQPLQLTVANSPLSDVPARVEHSPPELHILNVSFLI